MEELKHIVESLLFVSEDPLTIDQMRKVVKDADAKRLREALGALGEEYESRRGGFFLAEVAGGFQLRTRPEYNQYIKDLLQPSPPRLSKAALETLAIIAYKQPIIRADLEHIRGVDSGGVLRLLLKRRLIRVLGRKELPGRPLIYATTKRFLETFDLKDLRDLPTPREIEEFGNEASDELAAAFEALSIPEEGPPPPGQERGLFDPPPEKTPEPEDGETEAAQPETGRADAAQGTAGEDGKAQERTGEIGPPAKPDETEQPYDINSNFYDDPPGPGGEAPGSTGGRKEDTDREDRF
jgi:segregation and condensation protein B